MTTGAKIGAGLVVLANVVLAAVYREWWLLAVAAGLVAAFASNWKRSNHD
jgi:hypothetical protein